MSLGYVGKKFTQDYFEYERFDTPISVVGKLRKNIAYWRSIGCSEFILKVLQNGYIIPVIGEIETAYLNNNRSSRLEPEFVQRSIDELLEVGAVVKSLEKPYIVNPLTVVNKDGKKRLVIDMRHLNDRIRKTKCKFDGHDVAQQFLVKSGFMTVFNLKSGYHHIDVHESQHELLGFAYEDHEGNERYFKFVVLPFGLATARYIFTKVLRELIRHWRSMQIQAVAFLGDGLQANSNYRISKAHAIQIKGSLIMAGWVPHRSKSIWEPKQIVSWLGFNIDLIKGLISVKEERIHKLVVLITKMLCMKTVHIKRIAQVKGMLASMERSHGDVVHLMTRFLNLAIGEAESWNVQVCMNEPITKELKFWLKNVRKLNGSNLFPSVGTASIDFSLYSDASSTGCAIVLTPSPKQDKLIVNRMFTKQEVESSSMERELLGVLHGLTQLRDVLEGCSINWYTDSQNVPCIVKRGSRKPYLANVAVAIYNVVKEQKMKLNIIWIPRTLNEEADFWPRIRDFDDWEVSQHWFTEICKYFKFVPTVERFANFENRKLDRFNSRFHHCRAEATDCFTQKWAGEKNWVVPPVFLVNRALEYCEVSKAEMVIVFPKWTSGVFWPKVAGILKDKVHVVSSLTMGGIFEQGSNEESIFSKGKWRGQSMALHLKY